MFKLVSSVVCSSVLFFASNVAMAQTEIQTPVTTPSNVSIVLNRGDSFRSGDGRFKLTLQMNGDLVLYQGTKALWHSDTGPKYQTPPPFPGGPTPPSLVTQGCYAQFQGDGNLVVLGANGVVGAVHPCQNPSNTIGNMGAMWASNTHGNPGSKFDVQNDGNVVIVNAAGRPIWSTKTCCR